MTRPKRQQSSHHLAQWSRFNSPGLFVESDGGDDTINIMGPIATQDNADLWTWLFETDYHTSDVEFQKALLASQSQHIKLVINSPGGDVWAGSAIRSFIQTEQAKGRSFEAHIVGVAASAAAFVAVAAQKVTIADMGMFMIHRAAVGYDAWGYGTEDDLQIAINDFESRKQSLREINKAQLKIFCEKTGKKESDMRELLRKETWYNADSAVEQGFCDEVQSSIITPKALQDKALPDGFALTPSGGIAHQRPAYLFAAAVGITNQEAEPTPEPPQPKQKGSTMYNAEICALLGLPPTTELSDIQVRQAFGMLLQQRSQLEDKLEKVARKGFLSKSKLAMKAHLDRGAITPHQMANVLTTIMSSPDPEAQLEIQDEIFASLPDGDEGGQTARQPQGVGTQAEGLDAVTKKDKTAELAHAFKAKMDEYAAQGLGVAAQQDKAMEELSDAHLDAYMHYDFDNEDNNGT